MAWDGVLVQIGAGESVDLGHVLGRLKHGNLGRRVQDEIRERHRKILVMVRRHVPLGFGELHRGRFGDPGEGAFVARDGAGHALGAQGDSAIRCSDHDGLGDPVQSLHAGTALPIRIEGGHFGRQSGHPGHAAHVHELSIAQDVAQANIFDHMVFDLRVPLQ